MDTHGLTVMKKLIVPTICALVGRAAGVAVPAVTAQSFSPRSAETPRWDQSCEGNGAGRAINDTLAENARQRGQEGFELVGTTSGWNTVMACYKRPAQSGRPERSGGPNDATK